MNKLIKISLVTTLAITAFSTSALAKNTLAESFANGKLKGELKSFYFARGFDNGGKKDASIFVNGGSLNYITDSFYGFKLGATLQTSHVTSKDDDNNAYAKDMDASGTRLSEAYLQYTVNKTQLKFGRQYIATPLVFGSPARMAHQAFEAYTLTNIDLPSTKIIASYITKFQQRTDKVDASDTNSGDIGTFRKTLLGIDGTWMAFIKNNSIKGLEVQAQYYDKSETAAGASNGLQNLFLNAQYDLDVALKPYIAVQYFDSSFDDAAKTDNDLFGAKVGIKVKGFNIFTGYTETGEGNKVEHGIGNAAWKQFTASAAYGGENAFSPETKSLQFGVAKKFGALSTKLKYTNYDVENNGTTAKSAGLKETALNLKYKFGGSLKNLTAFLDYSILDSDLNNQHDSELRTRLIYKF